MKISIRKCIGSILFLIGLTMALTPYLADFYFQKQADALIKKTEYSFCKVDKCKQLQEKMKSYNKELYDTSQQELKDPWSYQQSLSDIRKIGLTEDIIATLKIPEINISLPIYTGASAANLDKGVAWLSNTSLPSGEINANVVLAAHRGTLSSRMFRDLGKLKKGDRVFIQNCKNKLTYKVITKKIIKPDDINEIKIQGKKDLITLLSCDGTRNENRLMIICERSHMNTSERSNVE